MWMFGGKHDDYLRFQRLARLQHVQQFGVVDLQQHARDLAAQIRVHVLNEREEALAQHLLLFLRRRRGQHRRRQRLLALHVHCLWRNLCKDMEC